MRENVDTLCCTGLGSVPTAIMALAALIAVALLSLTEEMPDSAEVKEGAGCFCGEVGTLVGRVPTPFAKSED